MTARGWWAESNREFRLRRLWEEGMSTKQIAIRLGCTKNAVVGRVHRLELPARPSPVAFGGAPAPRPLRAPVRTIPDMIAPTAVASAPAEAEIVDLPPPAAAPPARPPAPPPRPPVSAPAPAPAPRRQAQECCWPIGEPRAPGFHFCGDDALTGRPYCAEHCAVAYVTPVDRQIAA